MDWEARWVERTAVVPAVVGSLEQAKGSLEELASLGEQPGLLRATESLSPLTGHARSPAFPQLWPSRSYPERLL